MLKNITVKDKAGHPLLVLEWDNGFVVAGDIHNKTTKDIYNSLINLAELIKLNQDDISDFNR